jgi:uncharacterized membrane protein YhaH (DUF805 family)
LGSSTQLIGSEIRSNILFLEDALPEMLTVATRLFSPGGRIARRWFWAGIIAVTAVIAVVEPPLAGLGGRWATILCFLPCYWVYFCLLSRRCHDTGRSPAWLFMLLVPLLGFLWLIAVLFFRRGDFGANQYGPDPHRPAPDYLVVGAVQ